MAVCVKGCGRPARSRGLCGAHYEQRRTRDTAYGRWDTGLVDAEPVRQHVAALRAAGLGLRRIAQLADTHRGNLARLTSGRPDRGEGPSKRIGRDLADRILAIPVPEVVHRVAAGGQKIDATGTIRRLQALVAAGYSQGDLFGRLGLDATNGSTLLRQAAVTAETARRVENLYTTLQLVPGPSSRARARARRLGWPPPLAWDEETIDDPDATPHVEPCPSAGFADRYTEMRDLGLSDADILRRMQIKPASLARQLERHRIPVRDDLRALLRKDEVAQ